MQRTPRQSQHSNAVDCRFAPLPLCPDPEIAGKVVLIVLTGTGNRWRVLEGLVGTGARVCLYAPRLAPWALNYVPLERWIVGPTDSCAAAYATLQTWMRDSGAYDCILSMLLPPPLQ